MDQIQIIRHTDVCISCAEVCLQLAYLLQGECLDSLIVRTEKILHLLIHLALVKREQVCGKGLPYHLAAFYLDSHRTHAQKMAMAAGIDQTYTVVLVDDRTVIMGTDDKVNTAKTLEKIQPLILRNSAVTTTCTCMGGNDNHIRLFLGHNTVHNLLGKRKKGLELHARPQKR